jgi:selenoprotein W-related protein
LAAELQQAFGAQTRLIKGRDGVFEVTVDGDLVFSKRSLGRFPEPGEVAGLLKGK